jgi:hypothetical protein
LKPLFHAAEVHLGGQDLSVRGGGADRALEVIAVQDQIALEDGAIFGGLDLKGNLVAGDGSLVESPLVVFVGSSRPRELPSILLQDS